eukprot:Skav206733  [mRNA]  locus=scaffold2729:50507:51703:+ [translate_table: standard]
MRSSSSLPSLERCSRLVESTLYVARGETQSSQSSQSSPAEWLPLRFAHNSDGSISFWSSVQSETYLDADWTQPFTVAPWKPCLHRGASGLYPFSISYVPLAGRPRHRTGPSSTATALRRNLMLAAPSEAVRRRWLSSLARKVGSLQLRPSNTAGEDGDHGDHGDHGPKRRFMELGALQTGLDKTRFLGRSIPRLPPAKKEFWEAKSSLQMVRDLYDGYASDPLSCQSWSVESGDSRGDDEFMMQYLEKQGVIEYLLHRKQGRLENLKASTSTAVEAEVHRDEDAKSAKVQLPVAKEEKEVQIVVPKFELLSRTKNLKLLPGDLLCNKKWSGGAIFARANEEDPSFELALTLQDDPETHPIILGIAPPDADLSQAEVWVDLVIVRISVIELDWDIIHFQ